MSVPPPPYEILNGGQIGAGQPPPPPHPNPVPRPNSQDDQKPKPCGGKSRFTCICCCYCFLFILVLIPACLTFYFYVIDPPQIPSYEVEGFEVEAFDLMPDFSLRADFLVNVKAVNPNNYIGIIYGEGSSVRVYYADNELCHGKLPSFYQEQRNTSYIEIGMTGKSDFGSGLQEALAESRKNKKVPLLVRVQVPVTVVVLKIPLRQFLVFVKVYMDLDNLAPYKKIQILSSNTTIDYKL